MIDRQAHNREYLNRNNHRFLTVYETQQTKNQTLWRKRTWN